MKRLMVFLLLLFSALAPRLASSESHFIVRSDSGSSGIDSICTRLGLQLVRPLDSFPHQMFLLSAPDSLSPEAVLEWLEEEEGVEQAEAVQRVSVPEASPVASLNPSVAAAQQWLTDSQPVDYFGASVWSGYLRQPATAIIRLEAARARFDLAGSTTVAVIDTGVDPDHPALQGALVPGYDFTRDVPGIPSELADLDQSTVTVLNDSKKARLNQSTVTVLNKSGKVNQSTLAVLDGEAATLLSDPAYAAFGHGTMMAGIIHLVAPNAKIMPLKAFRADGTGASSDIVRAIYFAVENGAKVINMSFDFADFSPSLMTAINHAGRRGVVCVASVGNDGREVLVYPAALGNVIGVASTDLQDRRSSFSNFGPDLVWLAAPGEGIITTYPGSTYAAGWGTSFSTPFVSGAAALLLDFQETIFSPLAAEALSQADPAGEDGELGYGRLDLLRAAIAFRDRLCLEDDDRDDE